MAKYKADHLKEMIRGVVREEVERALREGSALKEIMAETIAEVLSERYLRKLAESAVGSRPRGVATLPIMGDDEVDEEVPEPLGNDILAPGQPNPVFKKIPSSKKVQQHVESRRPRVDVQGIANMFFEGTEPLDQREDRAEEGVPIPVDEVPEVAEQAQEWTRVLQEANRRAEEKRPVQVSKDQAAEEERIKKMREKLDQRVVNT